MHHLGGMGVSQGVWGESDSMCVRVWRWVVWGRLGMDGYEDGRGALS